MMSDQQFAGPGLRDTHPAGAEMDALTDVLTAALNGAQASAYDDCQSARFLSEVVDNLPAMVFVKEAAQLRYCLVNKAREAWVGHARADLLGKTAYDFNSPEVAARYHASDRSVLDSRRVIDQPETAVPFADGSIRYVLTRKIPLLDAAGEPEFLVCISLDVTARKEAEQALERRNEELEAAHAALKENQRKLLVSEKMAALGRLTAGIAHEMNTPLAAIRAAMAELQALAEEYHSSVGDASVTDDDHRQISADMTRAIGLARKSAERAASFVRSVKHHTRDLSHHEKVAFDAVQVVRESVVLLDHAIRLRRCQMRIEAPAQAQELFGSPGGLAQIVTNLVNNAVDACPADGGVVLISLSATGEGVRLAVSDNGSGISSANMARLFDPMFTTKPFGHGTGLGLAIVHEIVHTQFMGEIDVTSTEGAGACFTITLPQTMAAPVMSPHSE